ncbi:hypothetical protein [Dokdonella sp.]|uniref:hypothetical protein n=1 Tax=Dokdonella sp. TaxID=2291710 RepID=UPI003C6FAB34
MTRRTDNPCTLATMRCFLFALLILAVSAQALQASEAGVEVTAAQECPETSTNNDHSTVPVLPELAGMNGGKFVCVDRGTAQSFSVESIDVVEQVNMQAAFIRVKLQPESDVRWQKFREEHRGHGLVLMRDSFAILNLQIPQSFQNARFEIFASSLVEANQLKAALLGK